MEPLLIATLVISATALLGVLLLLVMVAQLAARQEVYKHDVEAQYVASQRHLQSGLKQVIELTVDPMGKYVEVNKYQ